MKVPGILVRGILAGFFVCGGVGAANADGDKALSLWTCVGTLPSCDGELKFDGGTGKYTGITGNSKFKAAVIGQTQAGFSLISGEWRLP